MSLYVDYQDWWESTWSERHRLFIKEFGDTSPPGKVISFSWDDIDLMIPGACAMAFPPAPLRPCWLTISHGLSQPLEPSAADRAVNSSGYGFEFGFLTKTRESWCIDAIGQLMTYLRQSGIPIESGNRVPMSFSLNTDKSSYIASMGKVSSASRLLPTGDMRAILFWPYLAHAAGFSTSVGDFNILLGTTITQTEWEMSKATSSSHLLLILFEAGIGQKSDLTRSTVTVETKWRERWEEICKLPQDAADELLLQFHQS
jgi:hypothetical protein